MHALPFKVIKGLLGEVLTTEMDLINLSPFIPLDGDVPNKLWIGKYVSYG